MSNANHTAIDDIYTDHGNGRPTVYLDLNNPNHRTEADRGGGCTVATLHIQQDTRHCNVHLRVHLDHNGNPVATVNSVGPNRDVSRSVSARPRIHLDAPFQAAAATTVYTQKVNAGNDRNGNPRRGWYIYRQTGGCLGFLQDDGRSDFWHLRVFPYAVELCGTEPRRIPVREYQRALRDMPIQVTVVDGKLTATT